MLTVLYAMVATAGFAVLTNLGWRSVLFASLGGGLSWATYEICAAAFGARIVPLFAAAAVGALYAEITARALGKPATLFTLCAIVAMVPGAGMYYTMLSSINASVENTATLAIQTMLSAGAIAAGIAFVTSLGAVSRRVKERHPTETPPGPETHGIAEERKETLS